MSYLKLLIFLQILITSNAYLLRNETDCPTEALIDLTSYINPKSLATTITANGLNFPIKSIRRIKDKYFGCPCVAQSCLSICCLEKNCPKSAIPDIPLPEVYSHIDFKLLDHSYQKFFHFFLYDPCHGNQRYALDPEENDVDKFKLLSNGSIFHYNEVDNNIRNYTNYCLRNINGANYTVIVCFNDSGKEVKIEGRGDDKKLTAAYPIGMIISLPFFIATLIVYTILPELSNIHGNCLKGYIASLTLAYTALSFLQLVTDVSDLTCVFVAYIVHFSFLASFFWLNVMCFDIWWTFGGLRSLHGSAKQREKRKFIMYSIYAWGCASILTIICIIMDLVPWIPKDVIKPGFGEGSCWFNGNLPKAIYFYVPMGITVICNIFLFIMTTFKIIQHKKDTTHYLKSSESRRHDDNKQWFNLYLKLFIVMGINWSMEIISWLFEDKLPSYIWFLPDLANTLQGVIIFIIFVWKSKIKRLLIKRFNCLDNSFLSRTSTKSTCHTLNSTNSRCTTATPFQEKVNPFTDPYQAKFTSTTEESECC